jgi:ATP-binding cassette subfamily F protein uup
LQPADVLLLDEPTNDLDIPTLEILEESLLEYSGALLLVTHDRYMLDRVSTVVVGLDGRGGVGRFADYSQWEEWLSERSDEAVETPQPDAKKPAPAVAQAPKKANDATAREAAKIEKKIADAEAILAAKKAALEDPGIMTDAPKLHAAYEEMQTAQAAVEKLYERWSELEKK